MPGVTARPPAARQAPGACHCHRSAAIVCVAVLFNFLVFFSFSSFHCHHIVCSPRKYIQSFIISFFGYTFSLLSARHPTCIHPYNRIFSSTVCSDLRCFRLAILDASFFHGGRGTFSILCLYLFCLPGYFKKYSALSTLVTLAPLGHVALVGADVVMSHTAAGHRQTRQVTRPYLSSLPNAILSQTLCKSPNTCNLQPRKTYSFSKSLQQWQANNRNSCRTFPSSSPTRWPQLETTPRLRARA